MLVTSITERGALPVLAKTLAYNEAQLRVIAENVANYGTPGYRAKHLDRAGFQEALREAIEERGSDVGRPLVVEQPGQVTTDESGALRVTPQETPVQNILSYDGTNMSLEREMAELSRTGMSHQLFSALLTNRFDGLRKAIRGMP
ncbi:MAG TPA: hypothetical protein PKK06_04500 [Phycisphaerae bacterium]|nr:hypothetical protein [Phycisphaerae bacterium]HNU46150.1 hypothetical protein [Phycisphaerae bacterium]